MGTLKESPENTGAAAILQLLDRAAQGISNSVWPWFHWGLDGRCEYFGLRLIVVVAPDEGGDWGIVFERLQGSAPGTFQITRFAYGPRAKGGSDIEHGLPLRFDIEGGGAHVFHGSTAITDYGEFPLDESLFAHHDLLPGFHTEEGSFSERAVAIRAFLEANPGVLWPSPEGALAASGLPDGEILLVSEEFQHAAGPANLPGVQERPWHILPSQSPVFQSLAEAIEARDASLFEPGESNLDFRLHAVFFEHCPLPWHEHRVSIEGGSYLRAAMSEACVAPDARGVMPLGEARSILSDYTRFTRGGGRDAGGRWVWDMDRAWAALLSLEDADEFNRYAERLEWVDEPRGAEKNTALAERYGDGVLPWIAAREDKEGILTNFPRILKPTLMALGTGAAFQYLWMLGGWNEAQGGEPADQANALCMAWLERHPLAGHKELGQLALANEPDAVAILQEWAAQTPQHVFSLLSDGLGEGAALQVFGILGIPIALNASHILSLLDASCLGAADDPEKWPLFITGAGLSREYHAMRLIGGRAKEGRDWVVVLERVEGCGPSLSIARYLYSETLPCGHHPELRQPLWEKYQRALNEYGKNFEEFDERAYDLIEDPDESMDLQEMRTQIHDIRAWVYDHSDEVYKDPVVLLARVGFLDADILAVSRTFEHAEGPQNEGPLPSESAAYRSLAAALAERNGALFSGGGDTTDFYYYVVSSEQV